MSWNNRPGLLCRLRRAALRAAPAWRALASIATLGVLLIAPAALIAHELQDARNWNQSTQQQGKHVKPACQICTIYAAFEHALAPPEIAFIAGPQFGSDLFCACHDFVGARTNAYFATGPPLRSRFV